MARRKRDHATQDLFASAPARPRKSLARARRSDVGLTLADSEVRVFVDRALPRAKLGQGKVIYVNGTARGIFREVGPILQDEGGLWWECVRGRGWQQVNDAERIRMAFKQGNNMTDTNDTNDTNDTSDTSDHPYADLGTYTVVAGKHTTATVSIDERGCVRVDGATWDQVRLAVVDTEWFARVRARRLELGVQ